MKTETRYPLLVIRHGPGASQLKRSSILHLPSSIRSRAFTLMELLTVIAIIVVLAGLLFPALNAARRAAKEGKARVQINQLATAFRAYYSEYAVWPNKPTDGTLWASILTGNVAIDSGVTNNPRKIVFMEFKSGETNQYGIADPWGGPGSQYASRNVYFFGFDTDYNNQIDLYSSTNSPVNPATTSTSGPGGASTNTTFIIWSLGDPKKPNILGSWK